VSTDRLIDLLWGDDAPGNAPNALQAVVTRMRKALGPQGRELLVTRTPGYALAVGHDQVDAARFERLITQARDLLQYDAAAASDLLGQALGFWRGPANRWPSRKSRGWRSCGWPRSNPASTPNSLWDDTAR
jgi:DNA-binding SARP family transcriptional activator